MPIYPFKNDLGLPAGQNFREGARYIAIGGSLMSLPPHACMLGSFRYLNGDKLLPVLPLVILWGRPSPVPGVQKVVV